MSKATKRKVYTRAGNSHFVTFSTYGNRRILGTAVARQIVISQLDAISRKGMVNVSGFVIMPDHVHALLWFVDDSALPKVMRIWKGTSAHWLRRHYETAGPGFVDRLRTVRSGREVVCFWQRRYYDFNIKGHDKVREKLDYMHYNPVKAGLCGSITDWRWSSARWYYMKGSVGVDIRRPGL